MLSAAPPCLLICLRLRCFLFDAAILLLFIFLHAFDYFDAADTLAFMMLPAAFMPAIRHAITLYFRHTLFAYADCAPMLRYAFDAADAMMLYYDADAMLPLMLSLIFISRFAAFSAAAFRLF